MVLTHEYREDNLFCAVVPLSLGPSMARSLLIGREEELVEVEEALRYSTHGRLAVTRY